MQRNGKIDDKMLKNKLLEDNFFKRLTDLVTEDIPNFEFKNLLLNISQDDTNDQWVTINELVDEIENYYNFLEKIVDKADHFDRL